MATQKRIIGLPKTTATASPNQSTIAGGTSSILPTDTATTKLPAPKTPASVSNPSTLNPATKSFSDNITMPKFDVPTATGTTPAAATPSTTTPLSTTTATQGEPIGQNADGSFIYGTTQPTAPTTSPTAPTTTTAPTYSDSLYDPNNYLGQGITKDQFMGMNITDQQNLINRATSDVTQRQNIMDQVKFYAENKAKQEYQTKQNTIQTGIDTSQNEVANIQASQRIREAQTGLDNLKQNLGFLGTGGRPVKSATAIDGANKTLSSAEQTFTELKRVEEEYKKIRESGVEFNANQFEEQMRGLQKQLTDNVDQSVLQAMQGFNSEAALASIDTPKKLFALQQKYLDMIDTSVEGITNRQVQEMQNLQTRFADYTKQYAEELKTAKEQQALFQKNANTVNTEMSNVMGYYVDGNGSPIMNTQGQPIQIPPKAPMPPVFDKESGMLITFSLNENGEIVGKPQQVLQPTVKAPNIQKVGTDANGNDVYGYYDTNSGQVVTVSGGVNMQTGGTGTTTIDTIKKREGFRDKAYQDSTGTWTIGYGFTNVNGQPVRPGMTMDRGTADAMLQDEIGKRQNYMSYITVPLNESQKAALSSFEFNLGSGIREKNAMPILNKINQGDLKGAGELMKQYSYSKGQKLQGLSNRRNEEARLLLAKDAGSTQETIDPNKAPQYKNYIESGKLPVGMKDGTPAANAFKQQAGAGYLAAQEQVANAAGMTISNPDAFLNVDAKVRDSVNKGIESIPAFEGTMNKLIKLVEKNGTELLPSATKQQMQSLVTQAQLQAKEIYNLGVLNGPDLDLMRQIIVDPTSLGAKGSQLFGVSYKDALTNAKKDVLDQGYNLAGKLGLSKANTTNSQIVSQGFAETGRIKK